MCWPGRGEQQSELRWSVSEAGNPGENRALARGREVEEANRRAMAGSTARGIQQCVIRSIE